MAKRIYRDPPNNERCQHNAMIGGKGEVVRCGRRKTVGPFCQQHHDMAGKRAARAMKLIANRRAKAGA